MAMALFSGVILLGLSVYQTTFKMMRCTSHALLLEAELVKAEQWVREDIHQAGFMGCRLWQEPFLVHQLEEPELKVITSKVGRSAVYIDHEQINTAILIQRSEFLRPNRPKVLRVCDKIHIVSSSFPDQPGMRSFSSVRWFLVDKGRLGKSLYREDRFGKSQEVFVGIQSWTWEWVNPRLLKSTWRLKDGAERHFYFSMQGIVNE